MPVWLVLLAWVLPSTVAFALVLLHVVGVRTQARPTITVAFVMFLVQASLSTIFALQSYATTGALYLIALSCMWFFPHMRALPGAMKEITDKFNRKDS